MVRQGRGVAGEESDERSRTTPVTGRSIPVAGPAGPRDARQGRRQVNSRRLVQHVTTLRASSEGTVSYGTCSRSARKIGISLGNSARVFALVSGRGPRGPASNAARLSRETAS